VRWRSTLIVLVALLAGCGTPPPGPGTVTENYVTNVAQGDFASACAALDAKTRQSLGRYMRSRAPCRVLLARCFPTQASVLQNDQLQLYYSNVNVTLSGSTARVQTSGTAVANRIRRVTLAQERGMWRLTSYGEERCQRSKRRQ
jgi:hypothetical protein